MENIHNEPFMCHLADNFRKEYVEYYKTTDEKIRIKLDDGRRIEVTSFVVLED